MEPAKTLCQMETERFSMLSPFPEKYLPQMWNWLEEFRKQMVDDLSPQTPLDLRNYFHDGKARLSYAFLDQNGWPVGAVWAEDLGHGNYMGHLVFERAGITSQEKLEMARRALRAMFDAGMKKLWWESYVDNRAFIIFLKKLGARPDSAIPTHPTKRDGKEVKTVLLSQEGPCS